MIKRTPAMELAGSLASNLEGALDSARRHRAKSVYPETIQHWKGLVVEARKALDAVVDVDSATVRRLADALDAEISARAKS